MDYATMTVDNVVESICMSDSLKVCSIRLLLLYLVYGIKYGFKIVLYT